MSFQVDILSYSHLDGENTFCASKSSHNFMAVVLWQDTICSNVCRGPQCIQTVQFRKFEITVEPCSRRYLWNIIEP